MSIIFPAADVFVQRLRALAPESTSTDAAHMFMLGESDGAGAAKESKSQALFLWLFGCTVPRCAVLVHR